MNVSTSTARPSCSGCSPPATVEARCAWPGTRINRPSGLGQAELSRGESTEVAFETGDDALVAGGLGGPPAPLCVVAKVTYVGELGFESGCELGGGGEAGTGLADVGVGAGFGSQIA